MGDVATAGVFLKPSSDVRCFALKDLVFESGHARKMQTVPPHLSQHRAGYVKNSTQRQTHATCRHSLAKKLDDNTI